MVELTTHLQMMAAYNVWANRRLYADATSLSGGAYRQPTGVFFGSLHGTLNHLLEGVMDLKPNALILLGFCLMGRRGKAFQIKGLGAVHNTL